MSVASKQSNKHRALKHLGVGATLSFAFAIPGLVHAQAKKDSLEEVSLLEEVVISASKRETNLQTTAAAVTGITASAIENAGVVNLTDLPRIAPSLQVQAASSQENSISLRGISSSRQGPAASMPIAMYLDGAYLPGPFGQVFAFPDIERVEVLRGPQGVFSGRNATSGAINVITKSPSATPTMRVVARYGTEDSYDLSAVMSGPIFGNNDNLLFKLGGVLHYNPGWQRYAADTVEQIALPVLTGTAVTTPGTARPVVSPFGGKRANGDSSNTIDLALRYLINDVWTADFRADRSMTDIPYLNRILDRDPNKINGGWDNTKYGLVQCPLDCKLVYTTVPNYLATSENKGFNLTNTWDLTSINIKSITAARYSRNRIAAESSGTDIPQTQGNQDSNYRAISQEINVASTSTDALQWVGGLYFLDQKVTNHGYVTGISNTAAFGGERANPGNLSSENILEVPTRSYAAFFNVTYAITDALTAEVGGRYTKEDSKLSRQNLTTTTAPNGGFLVSDGTLIAAGSPVPAGTYQAFGVTKVKQSVFTPRVSVSYKLLPDVFTYATYSDGRKAPGFNFASANMTPATLANGTNNPSYKEEKVAAYELGVKSEWFDNSLRLNFAAYRSDYTNYQLALAINNAGNQKAFNGTAQIDGQELEFVYGSRQIRGLIISGSVSHMDARLLNFVAAGSEFGTTSTAAITQARAAGCTAAKVQADGTCDLSGNRMQLAPTFSGNMSIEYAINFTGGSVLTPRVSVSHTGKEYFNSFQDINQGTDGFTDYDATLTFAPAKSKWKFQLWGKNLGDERHVTYATTTPALGKTINAVAIGTPLYDGTTTALSAAQGQTVVGKVNAPRTYGMQVEMKF